ncbi:hypothetical protein ACIQGO_40385 [Streptomyces shenzhenensis]|uniref:hypothetical protein n=1 Tax=Streptomyces shenzhenensis TaxID=943815 RepID=UPI00380AFBDE
MDVLTWTIERRMYRAERAELLRSRSRSRWWMVWVRVGCVSDEGHERPPVLIVTVSPPNWATRSSASARRYRRPLAEDED